MSNIQDIQNISSRMINSQQENIDMFTELKKMVDLDWDMPDKVAAIPGVRKMTSTDPHDAIRAGTRVLSTIQPKLKMTPLGAAPENYKTTDAIERGLMWEFGLASKRRGNILADVVESAILYDRCVIEVVFLPAQKKALSAAGLNSDMGEAWRRLGNYVLIQHDPKNVFAEWSDAMLQRVLKRESKPLHEVIDFWGPKAKAKLKRGGIVEQDGGEEVTVTVYDYVDFNRRVIWVSEQDNISSLSSPVADGVVIMDETHDMKFLPWAFRDGGKELKPLLLSVALAGQWEDQNIAETLMFTEIIFHTGAPRLLKEGPSPDSIEYSNNELGGSINVPPGHNAEPIPPPQIDPSLQMMAQMTAQKIAKSTIPNVIQTGDFPSGTAYATLNLATQSGVKALSPYKLLVQQTLEDVFRIMLYWLEFTGESLETYPRSPGKNGIEGESQQILINSSQYDVNHLYLDVELVQDIPTDRLQRMNAANIGREGGIISKMTALDGIGIPDASAELELIDAENAKDAQFQTQVGLAQSDAQFAQQMEQKLKNAEVDIKIQQMMMEAQQKMQQAQQQAQQQGGGGGLEGQGGGPNLTQQQRDPATQQASSGKRGPGFNPALGGGPAAQLEPGATRESVQQSGGN
jgi:hypothetical protein